LWKSPAIGDAIPSLSPSDDHEFKSRIDRHEEEDCRARINAIEWDCFSVIRIFWNNTALYFDGRMPVVNDRSLVIKTRNRLALLPYSYLVK
jgi:hypothetical protein